MSRTFTGATGWDYFVPYEADVSAALQRLREGVFARGEYEWDIEADFSLEDRQALVEEVTPELDPWLEKCKEMSEGLPPEFRARYVEAAEEVKKQLLSMGKTKPRRRPRPKTIASLIEKCAESGTHSILDIDHISDTPEFGAITPFPAGQLVELFGSSTPSHDQIMEVYTSGSLEEHICERWQGIYIVAWRGGFSPRNFLRRLLRRLKRPESSPTPSTGNSRRGKYCRSPPAAPARVHPLSLR